MAMPSMPPASSPLSWLRVGSIAVVAVIAGLIILFDAWSLTDFTERDPRAIPQFPLEARGLQALTMFASLLSPFMLLGLLLLRTRAFGWILGLLIVLASASLAGAAAIYASSSAARIYFANLPQHRPTFLFNSLTFTFLAGLVIIGISLRGSKN